jgi:tRNA A37 N6-isopentenylltransferase MiaA
VDDMKRATQKYANYQLKWIRKKLLPAIHATPDTEIYLFDTAGKSAASLCYIIYMLNCIQMPTIGRQLKLKVLSWRRVSKLNSA